MLFLRCNEPCCVLFLLIYYVLIYILSVLMMYVLRSQDNLQQSASSFHHVDPKDWTQFVRLAWQVLFGVISLSRSPFGRAEGQKGYQ